MKRNILAILVFLTMHSTYSHAEEVSNFNDSIGTSISEDSLISLLFPRAKLQHVDSMIQEQMTTGSHVSSDNQRQIQRISAPETVYSIDKTKGVGEIPITSSVSPTGAKMYEVPIELPAGMNDYTPNLKLVYNSQNGYSVLGEGWDIDGISIISRCQRSIYYDGYTEGIKFDNNESFTLSGQKLIKTGEDNKHIWFETETGHIKVKSYLNNGYTKYFEVFYPDGTKGIFGDSTSITTPLYYPLMSMTDLFNNKISYSYTTNADSNINYNNYPYKYISSISYNNVLVEFRYTQRLNPNYIPITYINGARIVERSLLSRILIHVNNDLISSYQFKYRINNNRHYLLQEIGHSCNNTEFNPIKLEYGDNNETNFYNKSQSYLPYYYSFENPKSLKTIKGKIDYYNNNDGVIVLPNYDSYWQTSVKRKGKDEFHYSNLYSTNDTILFYTGFDDPWADFPMMIETGKGFIDIMCIDTQGNQCEDIIKINNWRNTGKGAGGLENLQIQKYRPRTDGYPGFYLVNEPNIFLLPALPNDNPDSTDVHPKYFFPGDFDGDGKMELFAISIDKPLNCNNSPSKCYIFDLNNNEIIFHESVFSFNVNFYATTEQEYKNNINTSDRLFILDYNGDGKSDICVISNAGMAVYSFEGSGDNMTCKQVALNSEINLSSITDRIVYPVDYNGDGCTDILLSSQKDVSSIWEIYISDGKGQFINGGAVLSSTNQNAIIQDINQDGKMDVITYDDTRFSTFINRSQNEIIHTDFNTPNSLFVPANVSSRNNFSNIISIKDSIITKYSFSRNDRKELLLTQMTNSLGVTERNKYEFINNPEQDVYKINNRTKAKFPYISLNEAIPVLAECASFINGEQVDYNIYAYEDAVFHRQGRGFCGFEKFTHFTNNNHILENTYDPYNYGVLIKETDPQFIKSYKYSINTAANKMVSINLSEAEENDILNGVTTTSKFYYDKYGYPTLIRRDNSDGISMQIANTYHSEENIEKEYSIGYLIEQSVTTRYNNDIYTKSREIVSFNKRKPIYQIDYINSNIAGRYYYTYDIFGNITEECKREYQSSTDICTASEYDMTGKRITFYDELGHENHFLYDNCGNIRANVDSRGNVTEYNYDDFGRIIETSHPDGTSETESYAWVDDDNRLYSITKQETGKPTVIEYYDAQNRKVRESSTRFDGSVLNKDYKYDNLGNLIAESMPYKGESASMWNTYTYDYYNRKVSEKKVSGKETAYSYNKNSITTTTGNMVTKKIHDSLGNVISSEDPGGTITYKLGADGQAESMTTAGITTKIEFDEYRRRMSLDDPSLGLIKYSYDESGNLAKMINANGDSILYTTISGTDKLSAKSSKEKTTEYEYNDYMQLTKSVTDNGAECSYTYDDYGRLASETEQFADKWLRKDYSYSDGNIASITYTTHSGMTATEVYKYANGHLIGIDIENVFGNTSGTIITPGDLMKSTSSGKMPGFVLSEENELGLTTKSSSGNIGYTLKYSECGIPVGRTARSSQMQLASFIGGGSLKPLSTDDIGIFWPKDTIIGGWLDTIPAVLPDRPIEPLTMTLYDIEYEYDGLTGNLLCKWEPEYDIGSYYYYDRLNRLVGSQYMYTNYDKKGNIISHSDYGDFSYDLPDKPYAISGSSLYDTDASLPVQQIGYTSFARPAVITEGNSRSVFTYNGEDERVRMELYTDDKKTLTRYYLGNCYELDETENGVVERLYLTGNYYSAGVVLVCKDGKQSPYSIARDELGSVTHVVNLDNKIFQDVRYDAWGRLCDPESLSLYTSDDMPELFLGRGYTGHEHLSQFGLINMNARLYDPMLGRFLSPDPYVQMPDFTQSFNRYAYCMNNPMIYKDENGEFFFVPIAAIVNGISNLIKHGFKSKEYKWTMLNNAIKLEKRLYRGCNFKNIFSWAMMSSWASPFVYGAHVLNIMDKIDEITELDGMLALPGPMGGTSKAMTVGFLSFGPTGYEATWRDHLFVHEYGHYIQSQMFGPSFLFIVGIPSLLSAAGTSEWVGTTHKQRWFEVHASKLGAKYMDKHYGRGKFGYHQSQFFFDYNAFHQKKYSPYINPRYEHLVDDYHLVDYSHYQGRPYAISNPHITWWDFLIF